VEVTLGNVGSEPIQLNDIVSRPQIDVKYTESDRNFRENSQSGSAEVEIPSGETATVSMGSFDAAVAGEWTIEAGTHIEYVRDGAETEIAVRTRPVSGGDPFKLLNGVSMTVDGYRLAETLLMEYVPQSANDLSPVVGLETAPDGKLFVVAEMTIENSAVDYLIVDTHPQEYRLGTTQFTLNAVDAYEFSAGVSRANPRFPGEQLREIGIPQNEQGSAWMLGTVDVDQRHQVVLEYDRWSNTGPPEAVIEITDTSYPEFELIERIIPDQWEDGTQRFGAAVRNVGTTSGMFQGIVQYETDDTEGFVDPKPGKELRETLEPGETAEVTTEYDHESGVRYRLQPFGETARL
jgi:hypothetical protein